MLYYYKMYVYPHEQKSTLSNAKLFAHLIDDEAVPEPNTTLPVEAYLDTLANTYSDPWQRQILAGLWELSGLAGLSTSKCTIRDPEINQNIDYAIDDMRMGFSVFKVEKISRAGAMLIKYARGLIERSDLPTSLLIADAQRVPIPTHSPYMFSEKFELYLHNLLGISIDSAVSECDGILDRFRRGVFTYTPQELFLSYWTIASALPDVCIPDGVGRMIYDARQQMG